MGCVPHVLFKHGNLEGLGCPQGVQLVNDNLHCILEYQLLKACLHQFSFPLPQASHHPAQVDARLSWILMIKEWLPPPPLHEAHMRRTADVQSLIVLVLHIQAILCLIASVIER